MSKYSWSVPGDWIRDLVLFVVNACVQARFNIQIHLLIDISWFQHGLMHWRWYLTIVEFYPCLLFITVDMEINIKAWSRCHKDYRKWKRSDTLCNKGCIIVFRTRSKHMWSMAVNEVCRVICVAFSWDLVIAWFSEVHPHSNTKKYCHN